MRLSPGDSVRVYFPNRSMVQSKPCGTVLTPEYSVMIASNTIVIAKMSKPLIEPPAREPTLLAQTSRHLVCANPCLVCAVAMPVHPVVLSPNRYVGVLRLPVPPTAIESERKPNGLCR